MLHCLGLLLVHPRSVIYVILAPACQNCRIVPLNCSIILATERGDMIPILSCQPCRIVLLEPIILATGELCHNAFPDRQLGSQKYFSEEKFHQWKWKFVPLFLLLVRGYMILIQNANLAFKKVKVNVEMVLSAKVKVKSFPLFLLLVWGDTIPIQIANSQKSKKCSFSDNESEKCFISESEIRSIILATCERWHNADLDCQLGSHFPFSQLNINYQKNWNLVTWLNDIGNFVE